jgi:hypothetical protein
MLLFNFWSPRNSDYAVDAVLNFSAALNIAVLKFRTKLLSDAKIVIPQDGLYRRLYNCALALIEDGDTKSLSKLALGASQLVKKINKSASASLKTMNRDDFYTELQLDTGVVDKDASKGRQLTGKTETLADSQTVTGEELFELFKDALSASGAKSIDIKQALLSEQAWFKTLVESLQSSPDPLPSYPKENVDATADAEFDSRFTGMTKVTKRLVTAQLGIWLLSTLPDMTFAAPAPKDVVAANHQVMVTLQRTAALLAAVVVAAGMVEGTWHAIMARHPMMLASILDAHVISDVLKEIADFEKITAPCDLLKLRAFILASLNLKDSSTGALEVTDTKVIHASMQLQQLIVPAAHWAWFVDSFITVPEESKAKVQGASMIPGLPAAWDQDGYRHPMRVSLNLKETVTATSFSSRLNYLLEYHVAGVRKALETFDLMRTAAGASISAVAIAASVWQGLGESAATALQAVGAVGVDKPLDVDGDDLVIDVSDDGNCIPTVAGTASIQSDDGAVAAPVFGQMLQLPVIPVRIGATLPTDIAPAARMFASDLPARIVNRGASLTYKAADGLTSVPLLPVLMRQVAIHKEWDTNNLMEMMFEMWPSEYFCNLGQTAVEHLTTAGIERLIQQKGITAVETPTFVARAIERQLNDATPLSDGARNIATALSSIGTLIYVRYGATLESIKKVLHSGEEQSKSYPAAYAKSLKDWGPDAISLKAGPPVVVVWPKGTAMHFRFGLLVNNGLQSKLSAFHSEVQDTHVTTITTLNKQVMTAGLKPNLAEGSFVFIRYAKVPNPIALDATDVKVSRLTRSPLAISDPKELDNAELAPGQYQINNGETFSPSSGITLIPGADNRNTIVFGLRSGIRRTGAFNVLLMFRRSGLRLAILPVAATINTALIANASDVMPAMKDATFLPTLHTKETKIEGLLFEVGELTQYSNVGRLVFGRSPKDKEKPAAPAAAPISAPEVKGGTEGK